VVVGWCYGQADIDDATTTAATRATPVATVDELWRALGV
jgi:hypothetical protein